MTDYIKNELVKLRPYRAHLLSMPTQWVTVHAECVDDALKLGLAELGKRVTLKQYRRYAVFTPLGNGVDYIVGIIKRLGNSRIVKILR